MSIEYKVKDAPKQGKSEDKKYDRKYDKKYDKGNGKKYEGQGSKYKSGQPKKKEASVQSRKYKDIKPEVDEHQRLEDRPRHKKGDFAERMETLQKEIEKDENKDRPYTIKGKGRSVNYFNARKAQEAYMPGKKKKEGALYKENYVEGTDDGAIVREYDSFKNMVDFYQKRMPSPPSLGDKIRNLFTSNVYNMIRNTYDNTVGYYSAAKQNRMTTEHFKKNPKSPKKIVYLMHGVAQNIGSQWRLGEQLMKEGYMPYHLAVDHNRPREEVAESAFRQIKGFQKEAKIKNPDRRKDAFTGHSSGADAGIFMAGDERILESGIKHVQARAPAPFGVKIDTIGKRLVGLLANLEHDDIKHPTAKKNAVNMMKRLPNVPVHIVAGKMDDLAQARTAGYPHADKHFVIDHKDSSHFGTTGANNEMNQVFVHLLKQFEEEHAMTQKQQRQMKHVRYQA